MRCAHCGHLQTIHISEAGEPMHCRLTGCDCTAFVESTPLLHAKPQRICIDLPDGYTVSVSLIPWDGGSDGDRQAE